MKKDTSWLETFNGLVNSSKPLPEDNFPPAENEEIVIGLLDDKLKKVLCVCQSFARELIKSKDRIRIKYTEASVPNEETRMLSQMATSLNTANQIFMSCVRDRFHLHGVEVNVRKRFLVTVIGEDEQAIDIGSLTYLLYTKN